MVAVVMLLLQSAALPRDSAIAAAARSIAALEPVEAVAQTRGTVLVRDVRVLDIDGDGRPEAFVWIEPQLRQTPFILVYTRDSAGGMRRLLEGLAPGRLQRVSGRLVDDHTLGFGVDLSVGDDPAKPFDFDKLLSAAYDNGMSLVQYRTFVHADHREGYLDYVDLTDRALPHATTNTCESFEFSRVDALATGTLAGSATPALAVLTTDDITIYRFGGIRPNGTLVKQVTMRDRPANVIGLRLSPAGQILLLKSDGTASPLPAP
jgi:hypothetical protein